GIGTSDLPLKQIESLVGRHFADIDKIAIATPDPSCNIDEGRWLIASLLAPTLTEEQASIFDGCGHTIEARERHANQTNRPDETTLELRKSRPRPLRSASQEALLPGILRMLFEERLGIKFRATGAAEPCQK